MRSFRIEDCGDGCDVFLMEDDEEMVWFGLVGMPNRAEFKLAGKVGKAWMAGHDDQIDEIVFTQDIS